MPLDPQWPQLKLRSILQQAQVSLILWADTAVLGRLALFNISRHADTAPGSWEGVAAEGMGLHFNAGSGPVPEGRCKTLQMPNSLLRPSAEPVMGSDGMLARLLAQQSRAQGRPRSGVAYIMLTSGSTGKPHAVCGTLEGMSCAS